MKVLTDVAFGQQAFTWDHLDPFYSTNGAFDPTKLKAGTGSMRLDMTVQDTDLIVGSLKNVEPIKTESVVRTYILGPGE